MKVRILKSQLYSDFSKRGKVGAQFLEANTETDFPNAYAKDLISSGFAEEINPGEISPPASESTTEIDATASAVTLAAKNNVNLADVQGTGVGGRVTAANVREYLDNG